MFDWLISMAKGMGSLSPDLNFVSDRMDSILNAVIGNAIIEKMISAFSSVGMLLMVVYFLIDLMERVSDVRFTPEMFIKPFFKLILGIVVMGHLSGLLADFSDIMLDINNQICKIDLNTDNYASFVNGINSGLNSLASGSNTSLTDGNSIISALFVCIAQCMIQFITWSLSITRAFQITIRSMALPISAADIITNGMSSSGMQKIRDIFGLYLQSTVVLIIVMVVNAVCFSTSAGLWTGIVGLFVLSSQLKSSGTFIRDAIK